MAEVDLKVYTALAACFSNGLPIVWCASETAKWELLGQLRRLLAELPTEAAACHGSKR